MAYLCPMHPDVEEDVPGSCPICGMTLEADLTSGPQEDEGAELRLMTRRFWVCLVLTAPLFVLAMGEMLGLIPVGEWLRASTFLKLQLVLATPVVLWGGFPFFQRGWQSIRSRNLNMFTLIALGSGAAFGFSVVATLVPGLFPDSFRTSDGQVAVYFEAAAIIVTLVLLGQVLELRARSQAGAAIRGLLDLSPKTARRIRDGGGEEDVAIASIQVGDSLRIRPGERVPVDGAVLEGTSAVDESMVTGEPIPNSKAAGDSVIGGTLNERGTLVIRAERVGSETLLAQIVSLVASAQRSQAPIQRMADVFASFFVPAVMLVSVVAFAAWSTLGPEPRFAHALLAAVAVLIIACPCALGLATPMSIMVASGRGAGLGVLFRNAEAIETMRSVDTLVVDKTGTLTQGKPALTSLVSLGSVDESTLLRLAASLELGSEHPLAAAVLKAAAERELPVVSPERFRSLTGKGVTGEVDGRTLALGNELLLSELGIDPAPLTSEAERLRGEGQTALLVAIDGKASGLLAVSDPIKQTTPDAIAELQRDGVRVVVMTGDSATTARGVASRLGLEDVVAEVLPADKAAAVRKLQAEGHIVAMAGDGINDAPALAQANVGIAMGTGTDIAMESSDITLVRGDLRGISRARALSRATLRNIKQNLFFAFLYNAIGVPVAAGVLYPALGLLLNPMIAAAAMSLSSVSVIANALRLRSAKL